MAAIPPQSGPRVLMTADTVGGVWTYALDLAAGLSVAGVRTTLVVLGPPPCQGQLADAQAVAGVQVIETGLPLDWTATEPAEILETAAAVRGLARGVGADLIHLNTPALAGLGGFPVPVVGACHSCLATWWSAVKDEALPEDFVWRVRANWRGLHACDALIAPSRAFAAATARAYEVARPETVRNGRAAIAPGPLARRPIAFTSGRLWDEGKNAKVLEDAAARMDAPLYAAGPPHGPNGAAVDPQSLRVLGQLSPGEVADWLRQSAVYVSAARYEPFGLGVLEAAQAGCALVLSDIPTFRELWADAAVFVPADDAAGFARAAQFLVDDPVERAAWGRRARRRAAVYSLEAMCEGTLAVYRRLQPQRFAQVCEAAA